MVLTLKDKERFFKNRKNTDDIILAVAKKRGLIVFGARAVNSQVPKHLRKETQDVDLFTERDPEKTANRIEKKLDKKFKGDFFLVQKAKHGGTHKVIARIGEEGVADVSKKPDKIGIIRRKGTRFADLNFQKQKIKESLADKESKFRHAKDRATRARIRLAESTIKTKRRPQKRKRFKLRKTKGAFKLPISSFSMPKIRSII